MNILITGCAGFIGYWLTDFLIKEGHNIIGIDNLNDYYDNKLKLDRLEMIKVSCSEASFFKKGNFSFLKCDLSNKIELNNVFKNNDFDLVVNLAAQAGIRYSFESPSEYIDSNIVGFFNLLENTKEFGVKNLIYASSSSVYGNLDKYPAYENERTDKQESLYAVSKKTNELLAQYYSKNFELNCIGLRFFTVYGPYGRPDMATYLFTKAILEKAPLKLFNKGNLYRDFTYIDDIVEGINILIRNLSTFSNNEIINIGFGNSISVSEMISIMENVIGIKAIKVNKEMQKGDVFKTHSSTDKLKKLGYKPNFSFAKGYIKYFEWYKKYYNTQ
jgi:UDP-glucuronate 4-epimerase